MSVYKYSKFVTHLFNNSAVWIFYMQWKYELASEFFIWLKIFLRSNVRDVKVY